MSDPLNDGPRLALWCALHPDDAAAEIEKLRAERDAVARDMQERAAKLVETGVISAGGCITDHRQKIVAAAIRALPNTVVVITTHQTSHGDKS